MDANQLREMADKYDALQALKSKLEEAYCVLEEIEHACSHLDIMPSRMNGKSRLNTRAADIKNPIFNVILF